MVTEFPSEKFVVVVAASLLLDLALEIFLDPTLVPAAKVCFSSPPRKTYKKHKKPDFTRGRNPNGISTLFNCQLVGIL